VSYSSWFQAHGQKHREIVDRVGSKMSDRELMEYFRWDNMVAKEIDFCPLYAKNKKCHDVELLNCYLCACPNFRFDDSIFSQEGGKNLYSYCDIESKDGAKYITDDAIHQNCSGCLVPHSEEYIYSNFSRDWFDIMKNVEPKS